MVSYDVQPPVVVSQGKCPFSPLRSFGHLNVSNEGDEHEALAPVLVQYLLSSPFAIMFSVLQVMKLLTKGNKERTCEPTAANKTSSRSHALLQVRLMWLLHLMPRYYFHCPIAFRVTVSAGLLETT